MAVCSLCKFAGLPSSPRWRVGLLLLLAFGAAVRLAQYLGRPSYWYDEAFVLVNVFRHSYLDLLGGLEHEVIHAPLGLWLLRVVYCALGGGEWSMRLPAFLAGIAAMLVMVPLARRVVGAQGWLWPVAFGVLSGHAVMHGNEAKSYAIDHLLTELLLLAAVAALSAHPGRRRARAVLLVLGMVAPWLAFPSAFVLPAVSLALLVEGAHSRAAQSLAYWRLFNVAVGASALLLWFTSARHLYYPGLREHWTLGFPTSYQPLGALSWLADRFVLLGHYGLRDLGAPLLVLVAIGLVRTARRAPALAVLLAGPAAVGLAASFLRRYPMDDRCLMYAVSTWWLLAGAGILAIRQAIPVHRRPLLAVALGGLLVLPGIERCKELVTVRPRNDFRAAFAHVHEHWQPGDRLWISHRVVYDCYFADRSGVIDAIDPQTAETARRIWIVNTPSPFARPDRPPDCYHPILTRAGCVERAQHRLEGTEVRLFVRATDWLATTR